ncbi:ABC transporter ATP-binding protein [Candidatus Bipolaricaulota bacterium]|nr:ABC transporter ATP-binding protein [Candidatus Bipolaricaulota bacterium]
MHRSIDEVVVAAEHVKKVFTIGEHPLPLFPDLTLPQVRRGKFLTILGPSGCGKTTLLRMLAGLDRQDDGSIEVWGKPPGEDDRTAFVFQESRLLPWFDVRANVRLALRTPDRESKKEAPFFVDKALELVGLDDDFRGAWPHQLSGGMSKRVALARALVNRPKLLLLDEPFVALDTPVRHSLQAELRRIHDGQQMTTILVTHDVEEAVYLSDIVLVLSPMPSRMVDKIAIGLAKPRHRDRDDFISTCSALLATLVRTSSQSAPYRSP